MGDNLHHPLPMFEGNVMLHRLDAGEASPCSLLDSSQVSFLRIDLEDSARNRQIIRCDAEQRAKNMDGVLEMHGGKSLGLGGVLLWGRERLGWRVDRGDHL